MTDIIERLDQFSVQDRDWPDILEDAKKEIVALRDVVRQVDDVLVVDWITAKDGDYRQALRDLISWEISVHDDPQVSEVAASRRAEVVELRNLLKEIEFNCVSDLGHQCPACNGYELQEEADGWAGTFGHQPDCRLAAALKEKP